MLHFIFKKKFVYFYRDQQLLGDEINILLRLSIFHLVFLFLFHFIDYFSHKTKGVANVCCNQCYFQFPNVLKMIWQPLQALNSFLFPWVKFNILTTNFLTFSIKYLTFFCYIFFQFLSRLYVVTGIICKERERKKKKNVST